MRNQFVLAVNRAISPPLLAGLSAPAAAGALQVLLVWLPDLPPPQKQQSQLQLAHALFGAFPRPSGVAVLAVQTCQQQAPAEQEPLVESVGLTPSERVALLFRLWLGPGYEQAASAEGAEGAVRLFVFVQADLLVSFVAAHACLIAVAGSKKSRPTLAARVKVSTQDC